MKPVIYALIILLLSSCSVMKHKKESHKESSTGITQGSSSSTASVDTTKTTTNEYLRIYFPGVKLNAQPSTQNFPPFNMPDLSGATDLQREAAIEMQKQYNDLRGAYDSRGQALNDALSGQTGFLLELMKQTQENAGKSTSEQKQDSTNYQHNEKQDTKEKEKKEQFPLWQIIALAVNAILLIIYLRRECTISTSTRY